MSTQIFDKPQILECTLRDGSYAIDFQFTAEDTRLIGAALEQAGFTLIEIGHGVGLGASEMGMGVAAETDESYMKAASESLSQALWGMFCIPGIATLDHLRLAADHGMGFVRVGTNVEDFRASRPFIELGKDLGMVVASNFMKSYASEPSEFAKCGLAASEWGSDIVYVVDSAGGMLPRDVELYIRELRALCPDLRIGFHGHHNLGLGVANSLQAVQAGAVVIDSSLQGFGRSAGNASTEQLLCTLARAGYKLDVDPIKVMDCGERFILPLIRARGLSSIDVVSGFAQFHSSYMNVVRDCAVRHRVDPRELIIAVCRKDRVNAPRELVESEARILADAGSRGNWKPLYRQYYGGEQK